MVRQWLAVAVAWAVTTLCSIGLQSIARQLNFIDQPGGRKHHSQPIPLIGGVAMFLGFTFALLTLPFSLSPYRSFMAASGLLVFAGVLDDFNELSPKLKLFFQLLAALIVLFWGKEVVYQLGDLFFLGPIVLPSIAAIIFTGIAIIGVINAVNMIDGIDGLAGAVSVSQFLMLYWVALLSHQTLIASLLLLYLAVCLAFLAFNFPFSWNKAVKIFMGDSGSMFLGLSLAWFCIALSQTGKGCSPVVFLWIMAIPLFDMGAALFRRLIRRQSPFKPGRGHLHYRLLKAGMPTIGVSSLMCVASLILGSMGIVSSHWLHWSDGGLFMGILFLFVVYVLMTYCYTYRD